MLDCGGRTRACERCGQYVTLYEWDLHESVKCGREGARGSEKVGLGRSMQIYDDSIYTRPVVKDSGVVRAKEETGWGEAYQRREIDIAQKRQPVSSVFEKKRVQE